MRIGYFSSLVLYVFDSPAHLEVRDERAIARKYYGPSQYQVLSLLGIYVSHLTYSSQEPCDGAGVVHTYRAHTYMGSEMK